MRRQNFMKKTVLTVICGAMVLLAGCGAQEATAESTASEALKALYSCSETETADFEAALESSAENPAALTDYVAEKLDGLITEEGARKTVENRAAGQTALAWPDTAVEVVKIHLEPVHDQTDTEKSYSYVVSARPVHAENGQTHSFQGEIMLQLNQDVWEVTGIL